MSLKAPNSWVCSTILPRGALWSLYHESVSRCHKFRATVTKVPNFVPFYSCLVPESQFWCLFFKNWKNGHKTFLGSSSIRWKSEKILKNFIFSPTNPTFLSSIWIVYVSTFICGTLHSWNLKFWMFLLPSRG